MEGYKNYILFIIIKQWWSQPWQAKLSCLYVQET